MDNKTEISTDSPLEQKQKKPLSGWKAILISWGLPVVFIGISIYLPFLLQSHGQYHLMHILPLIGIYIILALGLNVIMGYTGILHLGYTAFYGIGAYAAALLAIHLHMSFWLILPLAGIITLIAGVLLGMPTLRLRGDYIAIVTLGFVEIVRLGLNNLDSITNGPKGLPGVNQSIMTPSISFGSYKLLLNDDIHYYFFILGLVLLTIFIMHRLHNSRIGRAWVSIREDEIASELMGVNTTIMKIYAFGVGSFFAGVAGCIYVHWIGFITPELFTFWEAVLIVCMVVLGGMGNINGVILGTILIVGIPEVLRDVLQSISNNLSDAPSADAWQKWIENLNLGRMLLFGGIMVIMVIFRSQGIIPARRPKTSLRRVLPKAGKTSKEGP
jgi:branched-chain amino acid transport system permease protein